MTSKELKDFNKLHICTNAHKCKEGNCIHSSVHKAFPACRKKGCAWRLGNYICRVAKEAEIILENF